MSVKVMGKVWDLELPHNQLLVLLAMADHADHDGSKVFPSIGLIAWKTGYSEKQVHRIQRELVKLGILVEVNRTQGKSVLYRIETEKGTEKKPYTPRQYVTPDKMSVQTFDTINPSQNVPTTPDMASPVSSAEPSLNHHIEPSEENTPLPPKRGKREKVTNADTLQENESINAVIQGYVNGLSIAPATNQYGNKTARRAALAIHNAGYTPAQVTRYTEHLQAQLYWQGKKPPLTSVAEGIAAYVAALPKPKPVFEIPEGHYDPALDDGTPATPEQIAQAKANFAALVKSKSGNTQVKQHAE